MEFKKAFAKVKRELYPSRQRFSLPPAAGEARGKTLEDSSKLSEYGLKNGSVLQFKDLGPQVSDLNQAAAARSLIMCAGGSCLVHYRKFQVCCH